MRRWKNLTSTHRGELSRLFGMNRRVLRWQRLKPFEKLAEMLLKHLDGIVNYCRSNRGRGYKNLRYLLLKVKRMALTNVEFIAIRSMKKAA